MKVSELANALADPALARLTNMSVSASPKLPYTPIA